MQPDISVHDYSLAAPTMDWLERIAYFVDRAGAKAVFSTSFSLEDQIITHIIAANNLPVRIFTLDTGRLFEEVHKTHQETLEKYNIKIETYYPDAKSIQDFVEQNGINSFYNSVDLRLSCCGIRKVEPLNRALTGVGVWFSGIRREHSETRSNMPFAEVDAARNITKAYPLLDASLDQVWQYIRQYNIPYNTMYENGFPSIGCAPCTRAVEQGEDDRAGRWWWEKEGVRECGLHFENGKLVRTGHTNNA